MWILCQTTHYGLTAYVAEFCQQSRSRVQRNCLNIYLRTDCTDTGRLFVNLPFFPIEARKEGKDPYMASLPVLVQTQASLKSYWITKFWGKQLKRSANGCAYRCSVVTVSWCCLQCKTAQSQFYPTFSYFYPTISSSYMTEIQESGEIFQNKNISQQQNPFG